MIQQLTGCTALDALSPPAAPHNAATQQMRTKCVYFRRVPSVPCGMIRSIIAGSFCMICSHLVAQQLFDRRMFKDC